MGLKEFPVNMICFIVLAVLKKENELIIGLLPAFNLIKIHIFPKEGYVCALWIHTILKNQKDCLFKPDWV